MKYRLLLLDVDSTLINEEVIDELARIAGCGEQVTLITSRAMAGEIDFATALRERVALLAHQSEFILEAVRERITLTEGAEDLISILKSKGIKVGVVTGGFVEVIGPLAKQLDLDFVRGNALVVKDGHLTGEVDGNVIGRKEKAEALVDFAKSFGISMSETVAIGDGANDIEMIEHAELGIAFCAKEILRSRADISIEVRDLRKVLDFFS